MAQENDLKFKIKHSKSILFAFNKMDVDSFELLRKLK